MDTDDGFPPQSRESLFLSPKSFESTTLSLASKVPEGTIFLLDKEISTWMCSALAAGVAAKSSGAVACLSLESTSNSADSSSLQAAAPSLSALPTLQPHGSGESEEAVPTATLAALTSPETVVFLCSACIHGGNASQLEAFVRSAKQAGIKVCGTLVVRVEEASSTAWLFALGPVVACSLTHDGGNGSTTWRPQSQTLLEEEAATTAEGSVARTRLGDDGEKSVKNSDAVVGKDAPPVKVQGSCSAGAGYEKCEDEVEGEATPPVTVPPPADDLLEQRESYNESSYEGGGGGAGGSAREASNSFIGLAALVRAPARPLPQSRKRSHASIGSADKPRDGTAERECGEDGDEAATPLLIHGQAAMSHEELVAEKEDREDGGGGGGEEEEEGSESEEEARMSQAADEFEEEEEEVVDDQDEYDDDIARLSQVDSMEGSDEEEGHEKREGEEEVEEGVIPTPPPPPTTTTTTKMAVSSVEPPPVLDDRSACQASPSDKVLECPIEASSSVAASTSPSDPTSNDVREELSAEETASIDPPIQLLTAVAELAPRCAEEATRAKTCIVGSPGLEAPLAIPEAEPSATTRALDQQQRLQATSSVVSAEQHSSFGYSANNPTEDRFTQGFVSGLHALVSRDDDDGGDADENREGVCPCCRVPHDLNGNEDVASVFVVADGHGGGLASEFVKDRLVDEVAKELRVANEAAAKRLGGQEEGGDEEKEVIGAAAAAAAAAGGGGGDSSGGGASDGDDDESGGWRQALVRQALSNAFLATESEFLRTLDETWDRDDDEDSETETEAEDHACPEKPLATKKSRLSSCVASSSSVVPPSACAQSSSSSSSSIGVGDSAPLSAAAQNRSSKQKTNNKVGVCNAGSCVVAVCVLGGWMYTAHVGDCRAVLVTAALTPQKNINEPAAACSDDGAGQVGGSTTSSKRPRRSTMTPTPPRRSRRFSSAGAAGSGSGGGAAVGVSERGLSSSEQQRGEPVPCEVALSASALTLDHNCYNESEVAMVTARVAQHAAENELEARNMTSKKKKKNKLQSTSAAAAAAAPAAVVPRRVAATRMSKPDLEPIRPSRSDRRQHELRLNRQKKQIQQQQEQQRKQAQDALLIQSGGGVVKKEAASKRLLAVKPPLLRVAGSLAVTRAVGDMYLKHARYANDDLRPHVPYITAVPETSSRRLVDTAAQRRQQQQISCHCQKKSALSSSSSAASSSSSSSSSSMASAPIRSCDVAIVLASDGLWEVAKNDEVAQWVGSHLARNFHAMFPNGGREEVALGIDEDGCSGSATKRAARTTPGAVSAPTPGARTPRGGGSGAVTCSQELVLQALAAIAAAHRTTTAEVQRLKPGGERRRFHDDITATVLLLSPAREVFDPQVFRTP